MRAPHHQNQGGASGLAAALPRLRLAKLVHPGMTVLELVAQRPALHPGMDVRLISKGLA